MGKTWKNIKCGKTWKNKKCGKMWKNVEKVEKNANFKNEKFYFIDFINDKFYI